MKNRTRIFTWTLACLAWLLISSTSATMMNNSSEEAIEKSEWVNDQPEEGDNIPIALESKASGNLNENESPKPASTVVYTERFDNNGLLPDGWETESKGDVANPWKMLHESGTDYSARCTSYLVGDVTEWLSMKEEDHIDCSGYKSLELQFYLDYAFGNGPEYAQVMYKISSNSYWSSAQIWTAKDVQGTQILDLSSADGDPEVRIRFVYHGTFDLHMLVDDVLLIGEEQDDGDGDDDDDDDNGNGHKKSDEGIGGGVANFLLSPIGLIVVGGITAALVAIVIVVWVVKKKHRR
ncbi:MAG: hypothetical protein ACFFAN_05845 [Promethearchaeota archaeon]